MTRSKGCNLFARCALIRGQRDIEIKVVVGDYELTVYPKSLFSSDGSLLDGSKPKYEAFTKLLKNTLNMSQVMIHQRTQITL